MTTYTTEDARALLASVLARIAPEVDLDDADADGDLQEELGLDSMDFLNLVGGIHDETGLDIPERDYPQMASVDGALDYLVRHVPG